MQIPNHRVLSTDKRGARRIQQDRLSPRQLHLIKRGRLYDGLLLTTQGEGRSTNNNVGTRPRVIPTGRHGTILFILANFICVFLAIFPFPACAQDVVSPSSATASLPNAPLPRHASGTASVSGVVLDTRQDTVTNALVILVTSDGKQCGSTRSDADGKFTFASLPAGSYRLSIDAVGFAPDTTQEFTLAEHQAYNIPDISLVIAGASTEVIVRPTEEIAAEQVRAEEKQRLLGLFPNFYVSYIPDAAPLTAKQKFSLAAHSTFDWTTFVGVSMGAGIEQATNEFKGYGQGAAGYGKRWGALFADGRASDLLSHYVFAVAFHQDPRYFYQGTGTKKSRLSHALLSAFVARGDKGKPMPNYAYLLGSMVSGAVSNAYYPSSDRGAGLVFKNAAIGISGRMVQDVVQEFIAKRLTHHVPDPGVAANAPSSSTTTHP